MKKFLTLSLIFILLLISACTNQAEDDHTQVDPVDDIVTPVKHTGYTKAVPTDYFKESAKPGTVETFTYETNDYVRDSALINKTAYVYLPYGYDKSDINTSYDIFYLMHGWLGHAGEFFESVDLKNLFDNLIERGDIKPLIIVSISFYNVNSYQDFGHSMEELRIFHRDFREHLMPSIESHYHTYADSSSEEDLKASRDHRLFGGFSLGAVTTWLQVYHNLEYIKYFLPISGALLYIGDYADFKTQENLTLLQEKMKDDGYDQLDFFIYHAVGSADSVKAQTVDMANMILKQKVFNSNQYWFYEKIGGKHDYESVIEFMYNALPIMFGTGE